MFRKTIEWKIRQLSFYCLQEILSTKKVQHTNVSDPYMYWIGSEFRNRIPLKYWIRIWKTFGSVPIRIYTLKKIIFSHFRKSEYWQFREWSFGDWSFGQWSFGNLSFGEWTFGYWLLGDWSLGEWLFGEWSVYHFFWFKILSLCRGKFYAELVLILYFSKSILVEH
jgi:hypothetical protein